MFAGKDVVVLVVVVKDVVGGVCEVVVDTVMGLPRLLLSKSFEKADVTR